MSFEKRDRRVMASLTEKEYKKLERKADRAGMKVAAYIRMLIQNGVAK